MRKEKFGQSSHCEATNEGWIEIAAYRYRIFAEKATRPPIDAAKEKNSILPEESKYSREVALRASVVISAKWPKN